MNTPSEEVVFNACCKGKDGLIFAVLVAVSKDIDDDQVLKIAESLISQDSTVIHIRPAPKDVFYRLDGANH
jgi:hypothetical protein